MIIIDPYWKIKKAAKYVGIFAGILLFLALVFWVVQKMKPKPVVAPSTGVQKTIEEKQKDMLDAVNKAGESSQPEPNKDEVPKKQQETLDAVNEASENAKPLPPPSEQDKQIQDMLNAVNAASK